MKPLFNNLSYLIGTQVDICGGIDFDVRPVKAVIVDEYPKHLMLEMTFAGSFFGIKTPPRKICRRINKAAMYCGDIQLRSHVDNKLLTGKAVSRIEQAQVSKGKPGGTGNSTYMREGYHGYL